MIRAKSPLPATKIGGERVGVRGGISGAKPLNYVLFVSWE